MSSAARPLSTPLRTLRAYVGFRTKETIRFAPICSVRGEPVPQAPTAFRNKWVSTYWTKFVTRPSRTVHKCAKGVATSATEPLPR